MAEEPRPDNSMWNLIAQAQDRIVELRTTVAKLPRTEELNRFRTSLEKRVDETVDKTSAVNITCMRGEIGQGLGKKADQTFVKEIDERTVELTRRVDDLQSKLTGTVSVSRVKEVEKRGDLLEKMVFNGVNILVLGLLTLAGAGLFFRAIDTKQVSEAAGAMNERAGKLEIDIEKRQSSISNKVDEDLVKLRDSIDKKAQDAATQFDSRLSNMSRSLGELSVAVAKGDNEVGNNAELELDKTTNRLAGVEAKVMGLESIVTDKINVKLSQLDALISRM